MKERERITTTYGKVQAKYPHVTDKAAIDDLAIKLDKRRHLLVCGGFLLGLVVSFALCFLAPEDFSDTRYVLLLTGVGCLFELFRTLCKLPLVERRYRPVLHVQHEGTLTREQILRDGGKALKKADGAFTLARLPLFDKEDETEVSFDNMIFHQYRLYFKPSEDGLPLAYRVKRKQYVNAVLDTEYYVALTPANEIAAAYPAACWTLESALAVDEPVPQPEAAPSPAESAATEFFQPLAETAQPSGQSDAAYQPNAVQLAPERPATRKTLPILAMVLMAISFFCPLIIGLPLSIASLVLAIVGLVQQRSALSITSMAVSGTLFVLLILSVGVLLTGLL